MSTDFSQCLLIGRLMNGVTLDRQSLWRTACKVVGAIMPWCIQGVGKKIGKRMIEETKNNIPLFNAKWKHQVRKDCSLNLKRLSCTALTISPNFLHFYSHAGLFFLCSLLCQYAL